MIRLANNIGAALLLAAVLGYAALGQRSTALAQSVDYGALERFFGEPVTTSVTGKPQRASDAPANIEIITQDDIRRSGATSIPDVLRFVTGIDVREYGLANAEVGVRGYNQSSNPHLMVLVDGRQVYMVDYGRIIWQAIPVQLEEIRQIEVIKGPNSALYGFNAVGGVINIITFDPLKDRVNTATMRIGTQDDLGTSVVGTAHIGDTFGLRLSAGGFNAKDFAPGPLAPADRAARLSPYTNNFNADSRWQINPAIETFADLSLGQTRLADQEPPGAFGTERLVSTSARMGINADTTFGLLSLSAYRSDASVGIDNVNGVSLSKVGEYQTSYVVQASDLLKFGTDHTVRFGLEYRANMDDSTDLASGTISNAVYAASVMWDWQITSSITLTNALRIDSMRLHYVGTLFQGLGLTNAQYNQTTLTEPSFNTGLVWKVTDDDTIRLTAARGVQLPTLLQYAFDNRPAGLLPPRTFVGSPNLSPAIVWGAEVDYDRALPAIGSILRTALFVQQTDDVIAWPFGTPVAASGVGGLVFASRNVGATNAAGVELGIKGNAASGLRWNVSYALVATADNTVLNQGPAPTSTVEYASSTPNHVVIGGIGYSRDKIETDLMARWQSSFLDYRLNAQRSALVPVNLDNYITMTARIAYRMTETLTVALTAQQLNSQYLTETAGPPIERQIILSLTAHL